MKEVLKNKPLSQVIILLLLFYFTLQAQDISAQTEVIFNETFENGWNSWYPDYGVWEVGVPGSGIEKAFDGENCAGTALDGNYPNYTDSKIISPKIKLPDINVGEEIVLKFWQWFYYGDHGDDYGHVYIQVFEDEKWSWISLIRATNHASNGWTPRYVDLTNYAGKIIRLGFFHQADSYSTSAGWYIDNIKILKQQIVYIGGGDIEGFENGWGEWFTDYGVWQIGEPNSGPEKVYNGVNCAGTVLDGNYPNYTDSKLISPQIKLPDINAGEEIVLKFWQWFYYEDHGDDYGHVYIQVFEDEKWSWISLIRATTHAANGWTPRYVDLTVYAGKLIRLGFIHQADSYSTSAGWYIDEIQLLFPCQTEISPSSNSFESNGGTGNINITTKNGCSWNVTTIYEWITITSNQNGSGNGIVTYLVSENTDASDRQGTITIAGKIFTINQKGKCSYKFSPQQVNMESAGGTGKINIETSEACHWDAETDDDWITIISGSRGNGNGIIQFNISKNNTANKREGQIIISSEKIKVIQAGSCSFNASINTDYFGCNLNTGIISIETSGECAWGLSSNVDWIEIHTQNGSGNRNVTFSVKANPDSYSRTGKIKVTNLTGKSQDFSISQNACCTYSILPSETQFSYKGGDILIGVLSNCDWNASADVDWISFLMNDNGDEDGGGIVVFSVLENTTSNSRTGNIVIKGENDYSQSVEIFQSASNPPDTPNVSIDMNIKTEEVESKIYSTEGSEVRISIVANNVKKLDTYQVEVEFDPESMQFIAGFEDSAFLGIENILKTKNGKTVGFQAIEVSPGTISIANALIGSNCNEAPDGSGVLAILQFKLLESDTDEPMNIKPKNIFFIDCEGTQSEIKNVNNGQVIINYAGAAIDLDLSTTNYDPIISDTDIESTRNVLKNETILIGVVAQGVKDLDTYQVEVVFDPACLKFIQGYEDYQPRNIINVLNNNGGTTVGFKCIETNPGRINIANALAGNDTGDAPDGSGIIAILKFKILSCNNSEPIEILLENVFFQNSSGNNRPINNLTNGLLIVNSCLQSDFNFDGIVNFLDLGLFADQWLYTCNHTNWDTKFDIAPKDNPDCKVNFLDLGAFADEWLFTKECSIGENYTEPFMYNNSLSSHDILLIKEIE